MLFFSAIVTIPIMMCGIIAAALLNHFKRVAPVAAILLLVVSCGFALLLIGAGYEDALTAPALLDDTRWTPKLSLPSATLFAVPLLLLLIGNGHTIRLLWRFQGAHRKS